MLGVHQRKVKMGLPESGGVQIDALLEMPLSCLQILFFQQEMLTQGAMDDGLIFGGESETHGLLEDLHSPGNIPVLEVGERLFVGCFPGLSLLLLGDFFLSCNNVKKVKKYG